MGGVTTDRVYSKGVPIVKKTLLMGTVAALLLSLQVVCPAQEAATESSAGQMKPLVTVVLSSYDQVISDIRSISPQGAMTVEGLVSGATGDQGLESLDKKRPAGLLLRTDGQQVLMQEVLVFLPVTDLAKLLKSLEPLIGPVEAKDGIYEVSVGGQTLYLKQAGDWAFGSISEDGLANLPKDPLKDVAGLNEEYDVGVRATIKNIPEVYRQLLLGLMQSVGQPLLQQKPGESEEEQEARAQAFHQGEQQAKQALNELDTLVAGLKVDEKSGAALLDFVITALEGTDVAKQYALATGEIETNFAGFLLEDAALTASVAQQVPEASIAQVESSIAAARASALSDLEDQDLSEEELALAKELATQLLDVSEKTIKSGKIDMGASVKLGPEVFTLVLGAHLLDTGKVDQMFKKLAEKVAKEVSQATDAIKLNAEQYEGVQFHSISIPTDAIPNTGDVDLSKLVGNTVDVIVGIGEESVYLGAGRDALQTLKLAIDKSKERRKVPPSQMKITATPLLKFAGSVAKESQVQDMINAVSQILEGAAGKDHIIVTATAVPNGAKTRIELEEGVLKVLGALPMLIMAM
jgi:hypothetical protein